MSYILEALKKSDKERKREEIPDLQADHSLPIGKRQGRKPPVLHLLSAALLVLGSFSALFWWQFSNARIPELKGESKMASAPLQSVQDLEPEPPAISKQSVKPAPEVSEPVTEEEVVEELDETVTVSIPVTTPQSSEQDADLIPFLDDLSPKLKAGMPDLSFAGHVYADEARLRLIIINNRIVREGDLISNELSLEQIEPNGVVLRYKTAVFRVQLF
ncbi:MAG: general secretion pathway protein GspB [Desulfocapsa sp.]|nr:general secretion pathway protein GspB [Desulfocapsa sp.]